MKQPSAPAAHRPWTTTRKPLAKPGHVAFQRANGATVQVPRLQRVTLTNGARDSVFACQVSDGKPVGAIPAEYAIVNGERMLCVECPAGAVNG